MDVQNVITQARDAITVKRVFGEPYHAEGVTVIPAAKLVGGAGGGEGERPGEGEKGAGSGFGVIARPVGAYVIRGDQVSWRPAVDVQESDEALTLTAELPGLKKEDVNITLESRVLTLSGERRFENEDQRNNYHRIERAYGRFSRSFTLPSNVDGSGIKAQFDNGVLRITLPKAEEARPRKIDIGFGQDNKQIEHKRAA